MCVFVFPVRHLAFKSHSFIACCPLPFHVKPVIPFVGTCMCESWNKCGVQHFKQLHCVLYIPILTIPWPNYIIICIRDLQWKHLNRITSQGWILDFRQFTAFPIKRTFFWQLTGQITPENSDLWEEMLGQRNAMHTRGFFIENACIFMSFISPMIQFSQQPCTPWASYSVKKEKWFAGCAFQKKNLHAVKYSSSNTRLFWHFLECHSSFECACKRKRKRKRKPRGEWRRESIDWVKRSMCVTLLRYRGSLMGYWASAIHWGKLWRTYGKKGFVAIYSTAHSRQQECISPLSICLQNVFFLLILYCVEKPVNGGCRLRWSYVLGRAAW